MATIQIRNVPDETARTLKVRAASSGQSLQEYMRAHVIAEASKPTMDEIVDRLNQRSDELASQGLAKDLPIEETLRGIDEGWE